MKIKKLMEFCQTDRQKQILAVVASSKTMKEAAEKLGINVRNVQLSIARVKKAAISAGYDPDNGRDYEFATNGQPVSGYSTLVRLPEDDPHGRVLEWVKTNVNLVQQMETAKAAVTALCSEIPPAKPIEFTGQPVKSDEFCVVPLGDPHIGLMTWSKEVGHDWDLKIAHRVYNKVFARMFSRLPRTKEMILVNTGDFFHADNIHAESSRSGHKFDMDGRHGKWLEAGMVIMRMFIDYALANYEQVTLVNVPGNHDDLLGLSIGISTDMYYDDEPRVTVMRGENPFQYIERGEVLLGFAHGHTCRMPSLPGKMADDMYKAWGRTTYRHWITGHVHHRSWQQYKEHPGCSVESVGIIPPKDAYAHGGAFGARRGLQGIVYDPSIGEVMRIQEYVKEND